MAIKKEMPFTVEYINSRVDYDPNTGLFRHKFRPDRTNEWNSKFCGKIAGWVNRKTGYIQFRIDDKLFRAHRVAYFIMTGIDPLVIDHLNGVRHDNRFLNLNNSTTIGNANNQKLKSNNKSGHYGIGFDKVLKKWRCRITVNKVRLHLGFYSDYNEAVSVRKAAEIQYGYSPRHGELKIKPL